MIAKELVEVMDKAGSERAASEDVHLNICKAR